jgi:hypothetical protein
MLTASVLGVRCDRFRKLQPDRVQQRLRRNLHHGVILGERRREPQLVPRAGRSFRPPVVIVEEPLSYFYLPLLQTYRPGVSVLLRTHGDPSVLAPALTSEFQRLDADLPLTQIMTMKTFMD